MVVAFGGDGTVNEAANGLVGSDTPLCCLPGGRANVYCRMLGIPTDVVDATEHLLRMADDWQPRRVDVGRVNDRYFMFSAGVGLDASVVELVDAHPRLKARLGEWYYTWAARQDLQPALPGAPAAARAQIGEETHRRRHRDRPERHPYTYFGDRPVRMAEGASLDSGDLAGIVLRRASPLDVPTIGWRALSGRSHVVRPPPRPRLQRRERGARLAASTTGRCRSRSTATTSATSTRRFSRACPRASLVVS